jgi:hypothetical protein
MGRQGAHGLMSENQSKTAWLQSAEEDVVFSDILESRHLVVFPWLSSCDKQKR